MKGELFILIGEAIGVYFLVLWAHSLRSRCGLAHFYALIGSLTAVMSWVTDAGVKVFLPHVELMVGSTVFYTALLLGVFVVYVFDGPRATRIAISTIAGVSIITGVLKPRLDTGVGATAMSGIAARCASWVISASPAAIAALTSVWSH